MIIPFVLAGYKRIRSSATVSTVSLIRWSSAKNGITGISHGRSACGSTEIASEALGLVGSSFMPSNGLVSEHLSAQKCDAVIVDTVGFEERGHRHIRFFNSHVCLHQSALVENRSQLAVSPQTRGRLMLSGLAVLVFGFG